VADSSCILEKSGELMIKIKVIVDHMIELGYFKPTGKFKKMAGLEEG
jgi:hypothetical protein